ncbi:polymorphic toxin-type HINT domain-containing protein [Dyella terrae]|uniref:polymorphic toxin-type HINT domain-containing protein n=1 Tax=Dyella terrae TaxID=522259 RepID=UPI001EFC9850|nr:polymorphic toxin-type HINT domain-containing protein [Dyella terrae]ULU26767.1 Pretoxin HINT domain protein [Dyella terrae]
MASYGVVQPSRIGGGFIAGTLVWTDKGLIPIEQIKVGDRVLSGPDSTGSRVHRDVVRTIPLEERAVVSLRYQGTDNLSDHVLRTGGNHAFWVDGAGWTEAQRLMSGQRLQLANGRLIYVIDVGPVYRTASPNVGWEPEFHDHVCEGVQGDFTHGWRRIGGDGAYYSERKPAEAFSADPFLKVRVYDIEVEGFHGYHVGPTGVRVHDADSDSGK